MIDLLEVGKTYLVTHNRKGSFYGRLTKVSNEWATFIITAGRASAMLEPNERGVGEEVTVRVSFCAFMEVPS